MIKANELRIGNLLTDEFYDSFKTTITVGSINEDGINLFVEDDNNWSEIAQHWVAPEYKYEDLRPIPLTEEWLLKFGFKKWGRDDLPRTLNYEMDWIRIFPSNSFCDFNGYGFMHYKPNPNEANESARCAFQYVHQLQNLFYCLCGEELTLKQ